jgi:uncharacterized protein
MVAPRRKFEPGTFKLRVARSRTGRGVYAEENIPRGSCIIEYKGKPATDAQLESNNGKYLFEISDKLTIDGNIPGNTAKYINHSCKPNCEIDIKNNRVYVFAKRNIKSGEELNYDYDEEYFEYFFSNGRCKCSTCIVK